MSDIAACPLCAEPGGDVLYRNDSLRIVLVDDADYPGFCRVIWNAHVAEMSDLASDERGTMMSAVWLVESLVRRIMRPDKVNLASLGNVVPHLHWHIIPRYRDDRHFPNPVWASPVRNADPLAIDVRRSLLAELKQAIAVEAAALA